MKLQSGKLARIECTGRFTGGFNPPPPPPQMSAPTPPEKFQPPPPRKIPTPPSPRLRGCSHEKEVLRVSQSINSTDFLHKKIGASPQNDYKVILFDF